METPYRKISSKKIPCTKYIYKNKLSIRYQLIGFYHNRHDKNLEAEQVIYTKLNREHLFVFFSLPSLSLRFLQHSSVNKAFFWCEIVGGELAPSIETPEVGFFGRDELPPISTARVTEDQIQQFFDYLEELPEKTYFD